MTQSPSLVAESFPALSLAELDAGAALQDRVDVKYVISLADFAALAERLHATHAVLEIDGRRAFGYRTTYFDTAELRTYRDHVQQRRRRYKCRSREYLDSGQCTFEVKLKGARGRTVKHRMPYDRGARDAPSEPALAFLRDCLRSSYGRSPEGELHAALAVVYTRVTFAAPALGERVTCDFDLAFSAPDGTSGRLAESVVIVESKSPRGNATADRMLRALGARPEPGCSKYCLGVSFTRPDVRGNGLRRLLRRYFRAAPVAAVALALGADAAPAAVPKLELAAAKAIRDDPKVPGRLTVGGRTYRIGVELRGSSSQRFAKKPYAIETARKVRLLGLPREDDFDLNAFHTDPTLLRDVLAHAAARRMGLAASRTRFVELRVNGRYRGVYVLIEPPSGDGLLELTEPRKVDRGDEWFRSATGLAVVHADGDGKKKARRAVEAFEASGAGWRRHLDEAAAVDYMLHAELFKNQDAFLSSTYLRPRKDGRLALGPVWDFDLSAGNAISPTLAAPEGWLLPGRPWAGRLLADPAFRASLGARWRQLRAAGLLEALLATTDRHARELRGPARRNFARWPVLDRPLFSGQAVHGSHSAAVAALKDWLVHRAAWMDSMLD
jgi:hypothetical protein